MVVAPERCKDVQKFLDKNVEKGTMVNTDAGASVTRIKGYDHDYQIMDSDPEQVKNWLPWVHRFISNAKAWIIGTHHGVRKSHLDLYLAEYKYRFNRRHDPDSLFHRALTACAQIDRDSSVRLCT